MCITSGCCSQHYPKSMNIFEEHFGFIATFPISNLFERLNMMHKASLGHTRTRDVTTRPHLKKSRPEIQELAERKRGTQVEHDLLAPK